MGVQGIMPMMNTLNTWTSCQFEHDDNMGYLTPLLPAIPLTQALQALGGHFSVQLHHLGPTQVYADELKHVSCEQGFGREVTLYLEGEAVVWARSVCAHDAHAWHEMLNCGTQPLGSRLYELPLQRSAFEFAYLSPEHPANPTQTLIVSRRSCFYLQDASALVLTESFLPTLKNHIV